MYKVLKNDGSVQDFDWKKLTDSIMNAGATQEEAEKVGVEVEMWLSTVASDGVVKSYDLHLKVISILKQINPGSAEVFENFKKPEPQ
jgi:hypothetical protein